MWLTVPLFPLVRTHRYRMTTKFSSNASTVWPTLSKIQAPKRPNKGDESVCWKQIFRRSALRARREPDQFLTSDRGILSALRSTRIGSPSIFDITKRSSSKNTSVSTYGNCILLTQRHQIHNKTLYNIALTIEGHCPKNLSKRKPSNAHHDVHVQEKLLPLQRCCFAFAFCYCRWGMSRSLVCFVGCYESVCMG